MLILVSEGSLNLVEIRCVVTVVLENSRSNGDGFDGKEIVSSIVLWKAATLSLSEYPVLRIYYEVLFSCSHALVLRSEKSAARPNSPEVKFFAARLCEFVQSYIAFTLVLRVAECPVPRNWQRGFPVLKVTCSFL